MAKLALEGQSVDSVVSNTFPKESTIKPLNVSYRENKTDLNTEIALQATNSR